METRMARWETHLDEGQLILTMPEPLSSDSVVDLEYWMQGVLSRIRRNMVENRRENATTDEEST